MQENSSIPYKKSKTSPEIHVSVSETNEEPESSPSHQSNASQADFGKHNEVGQSSERCGRVATASTLWSEPSNLVNLFIDEDDQDEDDEAVCIVGSDFHRSIGNDTGNAKDHLSHQSTHTCKHIAKQPLGESYRNNLATKDSTSSQQAAKTSLYQRSTFASLDLDELFSDDDAFE